MVTGSVLFFELLWSISISLCFFLAKDCTVNHSTAKNVVHIGFAIKYLFSLSELRMLLKEQNSMLNNMWVGCVVVALFPQR